MVKILHPQDWLELNKLWKKAERTKNVCNNATTDRDKEGTALREHLRATGNYMAKVREHLDRCGT